MGNTQLKVYHALLSSPGTRYEDLGADYYDNRASIRRQIGHHVGKLGALGFEVTLSRIPEPEPGGQGTTRPPDPSPPCRPWPTRDGGGPLPRAQLRSFFRVSPRYRCARRRTGVKIAGGTARDVVSSWSRLRPRVSLTPGAGYLRGR